VEQISTPVLIVGGSLVGLSAAVFLSWQGVPVIVVERHVESSPHPRAIGYTARTMELFRAVGIVEKIPQIPPSFRLRRARVVSLAGRVIEETDWTPDKNARDQTADRKAELEYSPYPGAAMAQDTLEPLLRDKAVELGADLRQGTELLSLEPASSPGCGSEMAEKNTRYEHNTWSAPMAPAAQFAKHCAFLAKVAA
jgi:putative polyketide hydroxylase